MVVLKFVVAAELVLRDASSNAVSIVNITEDYAVSRFPVVINRLTFFSLWERDRSDPQTVACKFRVLLDNHELGAEQGTIDFGQGLTHRMTVLLDGFFVPRPGLLSLELQTDGAAAKYTIRAHHIPEAVVQAEERT